MLYKYGDVRTILGMILHAEEPENFRQEYYRVYFRLGEFRDIIRNQVLNGRYSVIIDAINNLVSDFESEHYD